MIKQAWGRLLGFIARKASTWAQNLARDPDTRTRDATAGHSILDWLGLGRRVNKAREDTVYFICLKNLAETIGKMPLKLFRPAPDGAEEVNPDEDEVAALLSIRPNPYTTPATFWAAVENNRNHYGNAYIWIQRHLQRGRYGGHYKVDGLWIMPSANVRVLVDNVGCFGGGGRIWYHYTDAITAKQYVFPDCDVIHLKTSHTMNGLIGESVQSILASTLEGDLAAQNYLNDLYQNGLTAKAILEYTGDLSDKGREALRESMEEFASGPKNVGRILPVPLGMKFTPMDIKLTDAQFFELKKYSALQLAAAFGIKPNQINDYEKASYANSEQQTIAFQVDTMLYPVTQYEQEIRYKLLFLDPDRDTWAVHFNEKALLRTDTKTQMEILAAAVKGTIYKPNEARAYLNRKPVPGGDALLVNAATVRLEDMGAEIKEKGGEQNAAV